jgi:hypothetical protein
MSMTSVLTLSLLTALLVPIQAQAQAPALVQVQVHVQVQVQARAQAQAGAEARALTAFPFTVNLQVTEAERERIERERERAAEQRDRQRERAAEQREQERARAAGQRQGSSIQIEKKTQTFRIGAGGELDVSNISGDIVITKGGGSEAVVEIVKTASARSEAEARELLTQVQVEIAERGTRGEIKLRYPRGGEMPGRRGNFGVSVAYSVVAPEGTRIRAASIAGSISATGIKGELSLDTISGSIRVAGAGRLAAAKSISGPVEIVDTNADGSLQASSASGGLTLRRVRARAVELSSISGDVIMDDLECGRVEAQTISGDVRFSGPITKNSRYELTSHSGNVTAAVSGGAGFEVDATSFSGSIKSDFPLGGGTQRGHGKSLHGKHGDGSAVLDLTTFSGSIYIAKR